MQKGKIFVLWNMYNSGIVVIWMWVGSTANGDIVRIEGMYIYYRKYSLKHFFRDNPISSGLRSLDQTFELQQNDNWKSM